MTAQKETVYRQLLVVRAKRGDRRAIEELVRCWEKPLFYYIRRLIDQEADAWDVLQMTWIRVLRGLGSLKDPVAFPAWLYRLARNTAIDHLRRRGQAGCWLQELPEQAEATDDGEPRWTAQDAERVHLALAQLTPRHREVLTLFFLDDLSLDEIGVVVGVPSGTVKSRLFYARRAIREILERQDER